MNIVLRSRFTRRGDLDIVFLTVARIGRSISGGMIGVALPYYLLRTLHCGALNLGVIFLCARIATAVIGFASGFVADSWGRRNTLVLVSMLLPVSAVIVYVSRDFWWTMAAAMVGGFSATGSLGGGVNGAVQPVQNAVLAELTLEEHRTKFFSVFSFISGLATALGALLAEILTVRDVFLAASILSLLTLPGLWCLHVSNERKKIVRLKTKAIIGKFALTGSLNGLSQGIVIPFLIPFFVLVYHVPISQMAVYAFTARALSSVAILGAPLLERKLGFVRSVVVTRGVGLVLLTLMPAVNWLPAAIAIYILAPSLRVMAAPIQRSEFTKRVRSDDLGRALSINQVARLAASSAGIGLSGYLMENALYEVPFLAYGILMMGNLYLYVKLFGTKKSRITSVS